MSATKLEAIAARKVLIPFIAKQQLAAIDHCCRGEEKQFFFDKLVELANIVKTMPHEYQQEGKGNKAVVYLHYFAGGAGNWWITERDSSAEQHQCFSLGGFGSEVELGYTSIQELIENNAELDLYWTPKTIAEIKESL